MLVAGRYEGMDARVEQVYADMTISVGDFVLMGGDLAALTVLEVFFAWFQELWVKLNLLKKNHFRGLLSNILIILNR